MTITPAERSKKWRNENRERYNAKRREWRKRKKEGRNVDKPRKHKEPDYYYDVPEKPLQGPGKLVLLIERSAIRQIIQGYVDFSRAGLPDDFKVGYIYPSDDSIGVTIESEKLPPGRALHGVDSKRLLDLMRPELRPRMAEKRHYQDFLNAALPLIYQKLLQENPGATPDECREVYNYAIDLYMAGEIQVDKNIFDTE